MCPYTLGRVVGMAAFIAVVAGCSGYSGPYGSVDPGVAAAASRATSNPLTVTPEPGEPRPTTRVATPPIYTPPIYTPEPDEPRHTIR
jgi:hypothetical protein